MSVYIKGMEMPQNCLLCPFCVPEADEDNGEMCIISGQFPLVNKEERSCECPLIEVPPHGRLIDADALMKTCGMATNCYNCPNGSHGWCMRTQDAANICEAIEDAPTIIPASEEG